MQIKATIFVISLVIGTVRSSSGPLVSKGEWTVYLRRAGPVYFGMSFSELRRVLEDPRASLDISDPDSPSVDTGCSYLKSTKLPEHLGLMLDNRRLVRIDVDARGAARTASGARVGDTEERIKGLYPGRIRVERHHYDPNGHYLIYTPADEQDRHYEIVFETDGKRVTSFRAGRSSATALVEGCS